MKYTLTISDLTGDQAISLINNINGATIAAPATTHAPVVTAAPIMAAPVAAATSVATDEDDGAEGGEAGDGLGVDSQGLPWDARIHSSNKKKKADGTWNKRRGVQEMEIQAVEAELRARGPVAPLPPVAPQPIAAPLPAPVAAPAPVTPMTTNMPQVAVDPAVAIAAYAPQPAPLPAPAPMPVPAPVAPQPVPAVAPTTRDMQGILARVQRGAATGKVNGDFLQSVVAQINQAFGLQLQGIVEISTRTDLVEYAHQILDVNGL